jgi:predicted metalloprotease with PDZ domain
VRDRVRALLGRVRAALRSVRRVPVGNRRQRRIAVLAVALTLLLAGAAYAVTATVVGGSAGPTPAVASSSGSRAWLGIDVERSPSGGVMVVDVFPGSPAQRAGMEPGDVITQINGHPIFSPSDLTAALAGKHPGDQVQLQFEGSGTSYSASVPLAAPPAGYP